MSISIGTSMQVSREKQEVSGRSELGNARILELMELFEVSQQHEASEAITKEVREELERC